LGYYVYASKALGLGFALRRQGKIGFGRNPREMKGENLVLMVLLREEDYGFVALETLVVLNMEKMVEYYLFSLIHCVMQVWVLKRTLMCMIAHCGSLVERPMLVGSDS
jgi:hypothetical protein